jgi:hypothetical protein
LELWLDNFLRIVILSILEMSATSIEDYRNLIDSSYIFLSTKYGTPSFHPWTNEYLAGSFQEDFVSKISFAIKVNALTVDGPTLLMKSNLRNSMVVHHIIYE